MTRGWSEVEADHLTQLRRATLELAGAAESVASTMELLRNAQGADLLARGRLVAGQADRALEQLRGVEAALVSVRNIAEFRAREPDHPGAVTARDELDRMRRLFNRLEAAVAHHERDAKADIGGPTFIDDALYAARDRVLRDYAEGNG